MNICAIIAEYNPLHRGHIYHIEETRKILGEDCGLAAVMSGHTVQRGDFPILTKFARTEMALKAGFDLVFELPAHWANAHAERFATAACNIITRLGFITHISFGSESGNINQILRLSQKSPEEIPPGAPNDLLAIEYLRALRRAGSAVKPIAIKRIGGAHDGESDCASAFRREILIKNKIPPKLPEQEIWKREVEAGRAPISMNLAERAVLARLRSKTLEELNMLPDVGKGGLAQRLHKAAGAAKTLEELYFMTKTKCYTLARIRRCVLAAYLGFTEEMSVPPPQLRLLGIGERGSRLLKNAAEPIISKPAASREALEQESKVTDILAFCMPKPAERGLEFKNGVVTLLQNKG